MLRMALNVNWQDMIQNFELYGDLPLVSSKVAVRRMKIAGHCVRHQEEEDGSKLTLWQPAHGKRSVGRRKLSYIDTLLNDTGLDNVGRLRAAMMHRDTRRRLMDLRRAGARPK